MPSQRSSVSQAVMRYLNRLGLFAALFLTLAIPIVFAAFSLAGARNSLELETAHAAMHLNQIVIDRPDLWEYELQRIQESIDQPTIQGKQEDRAVRTADGRVLIQTAFQAPWPTIQRAVPIYDSGRAIGTVLARRSIRDLCLQTLVVALASALLGWGLFVIFRLLPLRTLGQTLAELSEERQKITATLRAIPDGVLAADPDGKVIFLNPSAEAFLGYTSRAAAGRPLEEIYPVWRSAEPASGSGHGRAELRFEGQPIRTIEERFSPLPSEGSERLGQVIVFRDITTQLKAEAELLRIRQVESLGVLAGGIAHDFNNYLSAILGNISLAKQDLPLGGRATERLAEAMRATDRARALSLKLLTFAKGGDPARRVLAMAPLVREAAEFATHGSGVRFTCDFAPELWNAEVDDGLFSQVIHNLVINAAQAMQGQGHIHIRLENLLMDAENILQLRPGQYLRLSLQDSGPGIPEAIRLRIFEPYFTTKETGHGLGLASCFNIMRAHGGTIIAESPAEGGARFLLFVPATDKALEPRPTATAPAPLPYGRGHVLVMDDDSVLQEIAAEMLERTGFTAQTCPDGGSAIRLYTQALRAGSPFTAVIMDLTIPGGMGGREAASHILTIDPQARLIVSSGYSVDPVMARPVDYGFKGVLPKPYGLTDLARVLDEVVRP